MYHEGQSATTTLLIHKNLCKRALHETEFNLSGKKSLNKIKCLKSAKNFKCFTNIMFSFPMKTVLQRNGLEVIVQDE